MVHWYSELEDISQLAKDKGYEAEKGVSVLAVARKEILGSQAVKKALQVKVSGIECLSLGELWSHQMTDVVNFLGIRHIEVEESWLDEFNPDTSQVVFDKRDRVRAVILCTAGDEGVFVHLLLGAHKASEYIMAALQGFARAVSEFDYAENDRIYLVAAQPMASTLLRRLLDKKYEVKEIGSVYSINEEGYEDTEEFMSALEEAEEGSVVQGNISWKINWSEWIENPETSEG